MKGEPFTWMSAQLKFQSLTILSTIVELRGEEPSVGETILLQLLKTTFILIIQLRFTETTLLLIPLE